MVERYPQRHDMEQRLKWQTGVIGAMGLHVLGDKGWEKSCIQHVALFDSGY